MQETGRISPKFFPMNAVAIIPARMAATRFPGKPLVELCGRPMIQWVYERAALAKSVSRVLVATCDREILEAVQSFGGEAVMTSDKHRSGTDRIAEAAAGIDADAIVNVQGDEPLIDPATIDIAVGCLAGELPDLPCVGANSLPTHSGGARAVMTSLMAPIDSETAKDPNLVKVVVDRDSYALYFSRSPIPFLRPFGGLRAQDARGGGKPFGGASIYGHVGLYAYASDFLQRFAAMEPTPLERAESLEQLRALEYGYRIRMVEIGEAPLGVDTQEDLDRVRKMIEGRRGQGG